MKNVALAVAAMMALVGCGSSPEEDCAKNAEATCERMYTCDSSLKFGDDQADCAKDMEALCRAAIETNDGEPCEAGQTYDSDAAQKCTDETKALTCEQFNSGTGASSCDQVCK